MQKESYSLLKEGNKSFTLVDTAKMVLITVGDDLSFPSFLIKMAFWLKKTRQILLMSNLGVIVFIIIIIVLLYCH